MARAHSSLSVRNLDEDPHFSPEAPRVGRHGRWGGGGDRPKPEPLRDTASGPRQRVRTELLDLAAEFRKLTRERYRIHTPELLLREGGRTVGPLVNRAISRHQMGHEEEGTKEQLCILRSRPLAVHPIC